MAIFQPVRAWRCFVQTAAMAETMVFVSRGVERGRGAESQSSSDLRCLETTHWACLKSEL
jgi:hypothetical protein